MASLVELAQQNPMAVAFGAMGLLCQLIWPVFRARKAIIATQFGIGADYGAQYALLGAWSGAGVAGLGATQTVVAYFAGERPWLRRAGLLFLPVVGVVIYATWSGMASAFALAAVTLIMVGRLQTDTLRLRILLLAASPFGIGYDVMVGALPALIGAIVSASVAAAMLVREIRSRRAASKVPARNAELAAAASRGVLAHA
jgi:hypothetical protein